jgi:hypothetical protein
MRLMTGRNADLVARINSPNLKTLLKNLLSTIPETIDLTEITSETAAPLKTVLSLIQQVRVEESGPVVDELESLIDQIHVISGEYH